MLHVKPLRSSLTILSHFGHELLPTRCLFESLLDIGVELNSFAAILVLFLSPICTLQYYLYFTLSVASPTQILLITVRPVLLFM